MSGINRRTILSGASALRGRRAALRPQSTPRAASPTPARRSTPSCFQTTYFEYLKNYFPQFEEKTGIKVNFTMQAFPVYNQRTDLELSTKGSALDVINVTFIYSGRWIGAGWITHLDTFTKDAKIHARRLGRRRISLGGPQSAMKNAKGETFGFPWEAGAMILGAARYDLIEKAGLGMPKTFDELIKVCDAVHNKEGVAAFTADKLHHWNWIPYLMGLGGNVFKAPPDNLTPTLDTPQAAAVGRVVRQPADEVRAGRHPVLHRRPGDALADVGPRQHPHPGDHLDGAARQARREQGQKTVRYGLMPAGPERQLPRLQQPRPRHPGRLQEQGSGVGVHQVGAVQGDHRHGRQGPRLSQRLPAVGDQESANSSKC